MRIYITHCSAKKRGSLRYTGKKVCPDKLYASSRIQRFMSRCKGQKVKWAIFSDLYGVWFSHEKRSWYEKPPDEVTGHEFRALVRNFDRRLRRYNSIYFYHHPARFHRLYRRLIRWSSLHGRIKLFRKTAQIE
jgi:hypothetical protein